MSDHAEKPRRAPDPDWGGARLEGWGMAVAGRSEYAQPRTRADVARLLEDAAARGQSVGLRGGGNSYGDAALNTGGAVLDLRGMRRILSLDPATGIAVVEPGVTIRDLWRRAIRHGYWPPVVSGTMHVTIGGACAMNIHGKNNFAAGSFGEHVRRFLLLTPEGKLLECDRERNADVFHAAIGGFGMLGVFVEIELKLKRVHSGRLAVRGIQTKDLDANLDYLEREQTRADYLVGWLDAHGRGSGLGRGLIHDADQYAEGEDPEGETMLRPELQDVPDRLFGVVPKGFIWPGMWCAVKAGTTGLVNAAKFRAGSREQRMGAYPQTHGAFHFLLDYVPRWQWAFKPGGLIQFQPFVPHAEASQVYTELLERCQRRGLVPYLLVLKRHRPDPFLMTHAVDGFSLAMDFAVTKGNRQALWTHCRELAEIVLDAGGRFYYAKDLVLESHAFERIHGAEAVAKFRDLKGRLDPENLLRTDLSARMMGEPG